jgi:hypothetical protein
MSVGQRTSRRQQQEQCERNPLDVQQSTQLNLVRIVMLSMNGSSPEHEVHEWGIVDTLDLFSGPSA